MVQLSILIIFKYFDYSYFGYHYFIARKLTIMCYSIIINFSFINNFSKYTIGFRYIHIIFKNVVIYLLI